MDQFDEYSEGAKGMPVPAMMNIMAAIYSELARDPVMSGPAMYVRQALLELDGLCSLARQVQLEDDQADGPTEAAGARKRRASRAHPTSKSRKSDETGADKSACLTPLASLQPYSFLKQ